MRDARQQRRRSVHRTRGAALRRAVAQSQGRPLAVLVAAGMLVSACSGDGDSGSPIGGEQNEVPDRTEDSEGVTAYGLEDEGADEQEPDPTVVPDDTEDIDEAYAQAVIDEIDGYMNEALILARSVAPFPEGAPPAELVAAIDETFHPQWREGVLEGEVEFFTEPQWSGESKRFLAPEDGYRPGRAEVRSLEVVSRECLLVKVERDLSSTLRNPPDEPFSQGLVLVPHREGDRSLNQTPWQYAVPEVPLETHPEHFTPEHCDVRR
jgi:hypothetical protein